MSMEQMPQPPQPKSRAEIFLEGSNLSFGPVEELLTQLREMIAKMPEQGTKDEMAQRNALELRLENAEKQAASIKETLESVRSQIKSSTIH